ncbi:MARVEL-like domain protein [Niveomyces insectorum RCEF 264]|uniref:MARVEL-like domain protein n=1 Tax=Niveomyces insectorum RCEF 264 TaxID=1081102 RepID=A0A167VKG8_9HYPO|nr:MARVEL-like domain protein [Niveomyces insectorum RCEF 264]
MYAFVPLVHLAALVFAVVELGLTAYLVSVYDDRVAASSPAVVNFMLFNAIWSLLVLLYVGLAPLYYTRVFHRLASLALEWITMIFWFAGSIALAVDVGGPYHCGNNHFCGATEAAIAFGFFMWALFLVLVVVDTFESLRSRRHATVKTGFTAA